MQGRYRGDAGEMMTPEEARQVPPMRRRAMRQRAGHRPGAAERAAAVRGLGEAAPAPATQLKAGKNRGNQSLTHWVYYFRGCDTLLFAQHPKSRAGAARKQCFAPLHTSPRPASSSCVHPPPTLWFGSLAMDGLVGS